MKTSLSAKPASLSVHRNTKRQRDNQVVRNDLKESVRQSLDKVDVAGYALVTWDKDWNAMVAWHAGGTMPGVVVPEYVRGHLVARMQAAMYGP